MENKRDKIEKLINNKIASTLDKLENVECLDYFDIEIKVHQYNVDVRCTIKDKGRAY
ncbi:hypothetical protein [Paratissierella segnis]|jgi:hypothetical protein|uniref:Uncharacterized protein n=1 Tax=Paratissierella segnis TaxID=2763679 RepID=A0A926IG93_9FIRM|nr:hypothetical protein [Paratissierella segnis]MBC8589347.1 hypothetical protein [Paratissierella segnis]